MSNLGGLGAHSTNISRFYHVFIYLTKQPFITIGIVIKKNTFFRCTLLPNRLTCRKLPGARDASATALLRRHQPEILEGNVPISVVGDRNCLFRALSRGLFGDEESHLLIRLLTAIEMIQNRHHYDTRDEQYCDSIRDTRLMHDSYSQLLTSVTTLGGFSEFMIWFAASAALRVSVHSFCPPVSTCEFATDALTRNVRGRGVPLKKRLEKKNYTTEQNFIYIYAN